jgi:hypothetical protein
MLSVFSVGSANKIFYLRRLLLLIVPAGWFFNTRAGKSGNERYTTPGGVP